MSDENTKNQPSKAKPKSARSKRKEKLVAFEGDFSPETKAAIESMFSIMFASDAVSSRKANKRRSAKKKASSKHREMTRPAGKPGS